MIYNDIGNYVPYEDEEQLVVCFDWTKEGTPGFPSKTYGNYLGTYQDICNVDNLYEAFKRSARGSKWKYSTQCFNVFLLRNLFKLQQELTTKTYTSSPGVEFVLRERGKTRYVHGSCIKDRVVRHALCDLVLTPALEKYIFYNNAASQKNKGVSFIRKNFVSDLHSFYSRYHDNDGYVLFVDFSKFYDNIQHEKVLNMMKPLIDEGSFCLFGKIIDGFKIDMSFLDEEDIESCMNGIFNSLDYNAMIPRSLRTGESFLRKSCDIGDQVSQIIGIVFPTPIDTYATNVMGCRLYGRYCDDIYAIGRSKDYLQKLAEGIIKEATKLGIHVNKKKTRIVKLSDVYTFLQIKYSLCNNGRVIQRLRSETVTRQKQRMKSYRRIYEGQVITFDEARDAIKSWYGSYEPLLSKDQKEELIILFKELFWMELYNEQEKRKFIEQQKNTGTEFDDFLEDI